MREKESQERSANELLGRYAEMAAKQQEALTRIFVEHSSRQTDELKENMNKIAESVNILIQSNIEHKKDNEQFSERQERFEQIQREQGKEIRANSDAILILDRDSQSHAGYWKHVASVIVSVVAAAAIMLLK